MTRAFLPILVAGIGAAAAGAAQRAPARLLLSPRRPDQSYGSPEVRTETPGYPRHATGADDVRVRIERIVRWNPDWIVASAEPGMVERTRASLLARPSVAETDAARLGHRTLLPAAAIAGAAFLIACDIATRTARPPAEIRLGVVIALCGAPRCLLILLRRLRGDIR